MLNLSLPLPPLASAYCLELYSSSNFDDFDSASALCLSLYLCMCLFLDLFLLLFTLNGDTTPWLHLFLCMWLGF
jgi:hypothetical protein